MTPFPNPQAKWTDDEASRRGFVQHGVEDTPGKKAYFIHMEAKPGKEEQVQAFLRDILAGVEQEPLTGPWFGLRYSQTTFAIFEAFPHAQGRHDHDAGPGGHHGMCHRKPAQQHGHHQGDLGGQPDVF